MSTEKFTRYRMFTLQIFETSRYWEELVWDVKIKLVKALSTEAHERMGLRYPR